MREMVTEDGRLCLIARRRQRGRGGEVLCVESRRDRGGAGRGRRQAVFAEIYDVTPEGNFEDHTILNRINSLELRDEATEARLAEMRAKLSARAALTASARASTTRCSPTGTGLMIAALAKAADIFVRVDWLEAAERAFDFVSSRMTQGRAPAPLLSRRRSEGAGDRHRLRQHDQGGARARERHRQSGYTSPAPATGSTCSTGIIGRRITADIFSPPTTPTISSCAPSTRSTTRRRTRTAPWCRT